MVQKYIIDKSDLPDLIQGKELALEQGNKFRAFCIEINGKMTNGDVIKAVFPNIIVEYGYGLAIGVDFGVGGERDLSREWWNAPYKAGDTDE
jgi:hypothetical protein